jgi:hypothetical protein
MEARLRFVTRLLEGEAMTELCREFGISRRTGCKILNRYKECGSEALSDSSRRPVRYAIWLVSFLDYDLGYIDLAQKALQPLDTPFGPRLPRE